MADPSCGGLTDKLHTGHPGNETSRGEGQTTDMGRQQGWEGQTSCEETFDVKVENNFHVKVEKTDSSSHIEQVQSHMPERPFHSVINFAHNGEKMADPGCGSSMEELYKDHPRIETSSREAQTTDMGRQQDREEQASCKETFHVKVEKTDSWSHVDPGCISSMEELYQEHPENRTSSNEAQTTGMGRQQDREEQTSCQKMFQVKVEKTDSSSHVDPGCVSSMEELYQEHPENGTSSNEAQTTDLGRQQDWKEQPSCQKLLQVKVEKTDSWSHIDPGCGRSMEELYQEHPENGTSSNEGQTTDMDRQQDREEQASCEETFYWEVEKTDSSSYINPGCNRSKVTCLNSVQRNPTSVENAGLEHPIGKSLAYT
ncbi:Hypp4918 [Branchiostoma lanceolatum]|uniref:Hypp4918 protein n=1 Tax=Branchiostoma lanceolatum TaxID=7740 RepID=A0A8K0ACC5_BRALA|nr:Hypp4918 [Branchiostoma lanceolatum]